MQEIPIRTRGGGPLPEPAAFRAVVDAIPHMVWIAAPDGSADHFNVQAAAHMGVPAEAAAG